MRSKICPYCYTIFLEVDFPHDFDSRVACGSQSCVNKGKKRLDNKEEASNLLRFRNDNSWDLNKQKEDIIKENNGGDLK